MNEPDSDALSSESDESQDGVFPEQVILYQRSLHLVYAHARLLTMFIALTVPYLIWRRGYGSVVSGYLETFQFDASLISAGFIGTVSFPDVLLIDPAIIYVVFMLSWYVTYKCLYPVRVIILAYYDVTPENFGLPENVFE